MRLCNKLKKHANGDTGGDDAVIELFSVRRPFYSIKDLIIDEMFRFARSMLDDDKNAGLEVLPFVVDVAVTILHMPGESEEDAIAWAGNKLQTLQLMFPGRSN
ncbi:hypothetical protein RHSIM_Rhsim09G0093600 [Rhododendron simsii]|uniref:Uncharacterized protein n=1 Tax=Rhododendron simsii TaxID=118357 RepID=A0A834GFA4_RHOSS|nr:hypothetical protein RHSIM_Rhsim09G0093600 [Rhododendron simsii]